MRIELNDVTLFLQSEAPKLSTDEEFAMLCERIRKRELKAPPFDGREIAVKAALGEGKNRVMLSKQWSTLVPRVRLEL